MYVAGREGPWTGTSEKNACVFESAAWTLWTSHISEVKEIRNKDPHVKEACLHASVSAQRPPWDRKRGNPFRLINKLNWAGLNCGRKATQVSQRLDFHKHTMRLSDRNFNDFETVLHKVNLWVLGLHKIHFRPVRISRGLWDLGADVSGSPTTHTLTLPKS